MFSAVFQDSGKNNVLGLLDIYGFEIFDRNRLF